MPYIGRSTDGFGVRNRFLYLTSASDTSVSGADANGATLTFTDGAYVDVYLNGVLLKAGTDYNTNTANTIAGLSALSANDEVTVVVYDVFTVADMVSATSGGTFSGAVTVNGAFTSVGIDDNADATTMTIDTSERIGVGTTTMNRQVVLNNNSLACLQLTNSTTGVAAGAGSQFQQSGNNGYIGNYSGSFTLFTGASGTAAQVIDANGHVTKPLQPAFSVTANQQNNISINASTTIQFANEIFDQNADFNTSNYTFTAPVTGKYMLNVNLRMDNVGIAHMYMYMILATSNREYEWLLDISEYQNDLDYLPFTINVLADMDASDTALVKMHIPNAGSAQSDVVGSNKTTFSGFLAC